MAEQKGVYGPVRLTAAAGNAAMASIANPEGVPVLVKRAYVRTITAAAGATSIDAGIGAFNATSDLIIDGQAVNAVGIVDSIDDQAGNAALVNLWAANTFLTVTKSVGNALSEVGLVADLYVEYIRV